MTSNDTQIAMAGDIMNDINKAADTGGTEFGGNGGNGGSGKRVIRVIVDIFLIGMLIVLDQYSKNLAVLKLKDKPSFIIWDGVFELCYLENRGAAFGIMQNMKYFFLVVAVIMVAFVLYALIKLPNTKKHILLEICLILIGAGAIGNMIDRLTTEYVVDFFYFVLINFPIFNVADIYVTLACILLIIGIMFVFKEDDMAFLKPGSHK